MWSDGAGLGGNKGAKYINWRWSDKNAVYQHVGEGGARVTYAGGAVLLPPPTRLSCVLSSTVAANRSTPTSTQKLTDRHTDRTVYVDM